MRARFRAWLAARTPDALERPRRSGQAMVEYAILLAGVASMALAATISLNGRLAELFARVSASLP
jgi:Flp pilus assembly pilin Flp